MRLLGIETSCDETATAVIEHTIGGNSQILSNIVWSQTDHHAPYGGVVPEIAARAHVEILDELILKALRDAHTKLKDIDAIAVTNGPGFDRGTFSRRYEC